ncbi:MAG: phosphoglucosamine mutase [Saprospiraceae bacterium]
MSLIISVSGIRGTIGGVVGENLTPEDIMKFSIAYGRFLKSMNVRPKIVIGRDSRISGPMVQHIVMGSLQSIGIDIINLDLSTTPSVELAVLKHKADGGIIITASHNPSNWNALKLLNNLGEFISAEVGDEILKLSNQNEIIYNNATSLGNSFPNNTAIEEHVKSILDLKIIPTELIRSKKYRILADCINSTGSLALPILFDALHCKYELINGNMDGNFIHNPEPLENNLYELIHSIGNSTDLGIAVDPDVDRLALVDEQGVFFGEEYTLVCAADYVLDQQLGNTVSNLSSSRALFDLTKSKGAEHFFSAVGEVHVVSKMKTVNAVIGGEGNGGTIYPKLHYGRDALVGIALVLANMATKNKTISELKQSYPKYFMHKDKLELNPNLDFLQLLNYLKDHYKNEKINLEDGLKIDMNEGWLHIRKSNTEPILRIYSEATTELLAKNFTEKLKELVVKFK